MEMVARAFPVSSRRALVEFGRAVDEWPRGRKEAYSARFGSGAFERWYYQEIEGKPYVLAVAQMPNAEEGYRFLAESDDEFTRWFRGQVAELTGVDLTEAPRGPAAELIYEFTDR